MIPIINKKFLQQSLQLNPIVNKSNNCNYDLYKEINESIKNNDNVLFGPIVSEFGWEIIIWAGIIRKIKIDNLKKNIIVLTRNNRKELYEDIVDEVIGFDIDGDYEKFTPRANTLFELNSNKNHIKLANKFSNELDDIILNLKSKYDNLKIIETTNLSHNHIPPTNFINLYYNFKSKNLDIIDYVSKIKFDNPDKNIIIVNPRHRIDLSHRNISKNTWYELYDYFSTIKNCIFFISGVSPSYIKPIKSYENIINIESETHENSNLTVLGITIELLNICDMVFGNESAHVHLAKSMNVPLLFMGDDSPKSMASKNWNVFPNYKYSVIHPENINFKTKEYIMNINSIIYKFDLFLKDLNFN